MVTGRATSNHVRELVETWHREAELCFEQSYDLMPDDPGYEILLEKGSTLQECAKSLWAVVNV